MRTNKIFIPYTINTAINAVLWSAGTDGPLNHLVYANLHGSVGGSDKGNDSGGLLLLQNECAKQPKPIRMNLEEVEIKQLQSDVGL